MTDFLLFPTFIGNAKPKVQKREPICCVFCGRPGNSSGYAALMCSPCKSFINNLTLVTPKHDERQTEQPKALIQRHVEPKMSLGYMFFVYANRNMTPEKCAAYFSNLSQLITFKNSTESEDRVFTLDVSLGQALLVSNSCYMESELSEGKPIHLNEAHNFVRSFVDVADFIAAIPELHLLTSKDKLRLVQHNYNLVLILRAISALYGHPKPSEAEAEWAAAVLQFSKNHSFQMLFYARQIVPILTKWNTILDELILLQLVSCFQQCEECTEEGKEIVRRARDKYTNMLKLYQRACLSETTEERQVERFRDMMKLVKMIKGHQMITLPVIRGEVLNNTNDLLGMLSYDLHARIYKS